MTEIISPNNVFDGLFSSSLKPLKKFGQVNNSNSVAYDSVARTEVTPAEQAIFDKIIAALEPGQDAYVAGGWVRDKVLGRQNKDIDIAVWDAENTLNAANHIYYKLTGNPPEAINPIGTTVANIDGMDIEFTPFRKETYTEFSNKPQVEPGDLESETTRRDLTINSLLYNIKTGMILDYTQRGIPHLQQGILDTPQDPEKTFREDPNRIMRVFRFVATLPGFDIDPRVIETIKQPEILELLDPRNRTQEDIESQTKMKKATPAEENYNQLRKMFTVENGEYAVKALRYMVETGAYAKVFGFPDDFLPLDTEHKNKYHHLDILDHTFEVFKNVDDDLPEDPDSRFILRMSAIYHDKGKFDPKIRRPKPKEPGMFMYPGHPDSSLQVAKDAFNQFVMVPNTPPNKLKDRIFRMIELHDVLMDNKNLSNSKVYNIAQRAAGPHNMFPQDVQNLVRFFYADRNAHRPPHDYSDIENFETMFSEMGDLVWDDLSNIINGNDVIERISPNADKSFIGRVLKEVKEAYVNGQIKDRDGALRLLEERMERYRILKTAPAVVPSEAIIEAFLPYFGEKGPWIKDLVVRSKELAREGKNPDEIISIIREELES